ncbi:hypothetical protein OQA88_2553 [Cercophora sp. LCS_1]
MATIYRYSGRKVFIKDLQNYMIDLILEDLSFRVSHLRLISRLFNYRLKGFALTGSIKIRFPESRRGHRKLRAAVRAESFQHVTMLCLMGRFDADTPHQLISLILERCVNLDTFVCVGG